MEVEEEENDDDDDDDDDDGDEREDEDVVRRGVALFKAIDTDESGQIGKEVLKLYDREQKIQKTKNKKKSGWKKNLEKNDLERKKVLALLCPILFCSF